MTTTEQPNSLEAKMRDYFRRMDYINDEAEKSRKIANEDKRELGTEYESSTGVKKKFLNKKYGEHRRAIKAEKERETRPPADTQTLEQLEEAIEGFKGTPLYDAAKEAFGK